MLPSSIDALRLMSSVALKIVPPVVASIISAYLLSIYSPGAKPVPETRVVIEHSRPPLPPGAALDAIAAAHDAARVPIPAKPTFELRQRDVAAATPEVSVVPAQPARAKAMREASAKRANTSVAVADKATLLPSPSPLQIAEATPIEPVVEPQPTRVLGVPVPRFVSRTGEKVADAANAMRPSRLLSASWEFTKQAANKVASAASAIVP